MPETAVPAPTDTPIVAFFDVDNTLLRGASVFHIAKAARRMRLLSLWDIARFAWHQAVFLFIGENARQIGPVHERGLEVMAGHREQEFKDLAEEVFERDIKPRLWPETVELTREHLRKGHQVWLMTAAPELVATVIAGKLGLTGALGTLFKADAGGVFTGHLDGPVRHGEEKAASARELALRLGANLADCWAYSDSRNDIPLLTMVGHQMVVNPDSRLEKHAKRLGWPILRLKRSSIKDAQKRVKREARATTNATAKTAAANKKR